MRLPKWMTGLLRAWLVLFAVAASAEVSFIARRDFETGPDSQSVAVGDFNNDGVLDVAVANQGTFPSYQDGSVSVLLGQGDARFQDARTFRPGYRPAVIAVGDFNNDGVQDLVVLYNRISSVASVLLGNGDGSFQDPRDFAVGSYPTAVVVGDFNNDGFQDLAVSNMGTYPAQLGSVSVLLGNGDGTFQITNYPVGRGPRSLAIGDFNGDGVPDLIIPHWGYYTISPPRFYEDRAASLLLGKGDGTFEPARVIQIGNPSYSVAVGDFNGDGIQDLAVGNTGGSPYRGALSVLLGNGDGSFQPRRDFQAGMDPRSIVVGDFNADGVQDLGVVSGGGRFVRGTVSVLVGNGDGSFQEAVSYRSRTSSLSIAVADFNEDGVPDLAVVNAGEFSILEPGSISIFLGNGDASFQATTFLAVLGEPNSVAVGDFNEDGIPDLAASSYYGDGTVWVFLGNPDGSYQSARIFAAGRGSYFVAVADFNDDRVQDLAVANRISNDVSILLGNGDGTFRDARNFAAGEEPSWVIPADFNGDGVLDLAIANGSSRSVSVLLGNGDGTFQEARSFAAGGYPSSLAVGDFNLDGLPDLVLTTLGSTVSVLLGRGDGTFEAPRSFVAGTITVSVAVADFNRDGVQDLAVTNLYSDSVSVLLGRGDGTFESPLSVLVGANSVYVAVADVNGDGLEDLAVTFARSRVAVLLGNGDVTFQQPYTFGVGTAPGFVLAADLNNDGLPDIAVVNGQSNDVSVLINNTPIKRGTKPPLRSCRD